MYIGTRCSDGAIVGVDAVTIAGVVTRAGTMGVGRTVAVVLEADGVGGTNRVAVDDERLGVVEVMEPALAEPPAPAQPATTIERTAAPATERAAYQRACLTTTHASE
jgi:hypothetical protein